jgi:ABC-type sugar transport system substrate-binding protein
MSRGMHFTSIGAALFVLTTAGCGSNSFLPPPPPELSTLGESRAPTPATTVAFILGGPETDDRAAIVNMAHRHAGMAKVSLRPDFLPAGDPAEQQAKLIRDDVERGVAAIIVEPVDSSLVAGELARAREKAVRVVLLDRPLTLPAGMKPFPLVTVEGFAGPAKQMVASAIHQAEETGLVPKNPKGRGAQGAPADPAGKEKPKATNGGAALLLVNDQVDHRTADRVSSIKNALKDAGVPLVDTITFHGNATSAESLLKAKLAANPQVVYVFADEDRGLAGAYVVKMSESAPQKFLIAAFVSFDQRIQREAVRICAAVTDRNLKGLVEKAVDTAINAINGKAVPDEIVVPLPFYPAKPQMTMPYHTMPPPNAPGN